MKIDRIQADYDALADVARLFDQEADAAARLVEALQCRVRDLEAGGWVGRGANAFYNEMEHEVFPALRRLVYALEETSRAVTTISHIIRQAEEEASRLFLGGGIASGPVRVGMGAAAAQAGSGPSSYYRSPHQFPRHLLSGTQVDYYAGYREGLMTPQQIARYMTANPFSKGFLDHVDARIPLGQYEEVHRLSAWQGQTQLGEWGTPHGSILTGEFEHRRGLQIDRYGLSATHSTRLGVYAGQFQADLQGPLGLDAAVQGYIGAEARADVGASYNPFTGDALIKGKMAAFAGASLEGDVTRDFGPLKLGVHGGVSKGLGYEIGGQIGADDYVFKADFTAGATAGVGGELGFIVELDLRQTIEGIMSSAREVMFMMQGQPVQM